MNKEFVTYEQAVALKDLGFDEPCIAFYSPKEELYPVYQEPTKGPYFNNGSFIETLRAPLYQQAFRWFREKHNLLVTIQAMMKDSWLLTIQSTDSTTANGVYNGKRWELDNDEGYVEPKSYEEAELATLNKLIEICKNK